PKTDTPPRIDHVLRHAIKQFVRRDRLDDAAFVLRAVVAKGRGTIKPPSQRDPTARNRSSDCAENKSTPSDRRTEFVVKIADPSLCKKSKPSHQCSFEHKNAQGETDERDQTRTDDGQANVARAKNRPKHDCKHHDRQQNEYRHGPKR